MNKKYSQIKFMTLNQVKNISSDFYFRGNFGEGKDYFDQRDEILKHKWHLEEKEIEKMFVQREKEENLLETEIKSKKDIGYFKVDLYFVGIAPRKRKVDRHFIDLKVLNHCDKEKITEETIEELKTLAKQTLYKSKNVTIAELNFRRWTETFDGFEQYELFDNLNFQIKI